jgi:hypothetical protein
MRQVGLWGVLSLLIVTFTFCCGQAHATTMRAYAMEDLVSESDLVVIGRAVRIEHIKNSRGKIVRQVVFKVEEYVVGRGSSNIVLQLLGGTIGTVRSRVSGEIELDVGEPVLLFVRKSPNVDLKIYYAVGMGQGCFRIVKDEKTGRRFVTQELDGGLHLVDEVVDDPMGIGRSGVCLFVSLERFVSRIRKIQGITKAPKDD